METTYKGKGSMAKNMCKYYMIISSILYISSTSSHSDVFAININALSAFLIVILYFSILLSFMKTQKFAIL